MKDRLITAIDIDNKEKIDNVLKILKDRVNWIKIGPIPFLSYGTDIIKKIKDSGYKLFLDLKFHDIPNTVAKSVRIAAEHGVDLLTVHVSGGKNMIQMIHNELGNVSQKPIVAGISVLSSVNNKDINELYNTNFENDYDIISAIIKIGIDNGIDHFVASGDSITKIKKQYKDIKLIVPGIRPNKDNEKEHKRVLTPKEAIQKGADYIVIGRPIINSKNPPETVDNILRSLV